MRHTEDHEREITEAVERRCQEPDCCYRTAVVDVTKSLPFVLSQSDTRRLIRIVKQRCPADIANPFSPSTDRELAIAREVDKMALHDELTPEAVPEIVAFLDFQLSNGDAEFLQRYIRWRLDHPILK